MLCKILRKLRLGNAALKLLLPLSNDASLPLSREDAETILLTHSPDPKGSALYPLGTGAEPEYDLAIVIPVYNVEKYLEECIQSVLSQTTRYSFWAIFVNDGSKDGSAAILEKYASDPHVQILTQENRGLSGARNTGITAARGRYLLFLDSDDRLAPGAVEALLSAAETHQAALVQGSFATFRDGGQPRRDWSAGADAVVNPPLRNLPGYAWGKLIRSDLFQTLRFPEGYWFEDSLNSQLLFPLLQREQESTVSLDRIICHYRVNPQGISAQASARPKALDSYYITRQLWLDREHYHLKNTQEDYESLLDMILLTYERTSRQPQAVQEALLAAWSGFLEEQFPGFASSRKGFDALENALKNKKFNQYSLCCKLL